METGPEKEFDVMTPRVYAFGAIMFVLGAIGVYMMAAWARIYPLLTVFFYSISANAAVTIFPHEPVLIWYGKTQNLLRLSASATLGTMLAGYLDYRFFTPVLNLSFSAKFRSSHGYTRAQRWFSKAPFWALTLGGFLPLPFYPFKFLALASKYPMSKYLVSLAAGRFPRYYILGMAGFFLQIPNWVLIASFVLVLALVYHKQLWIFISRPFISLFKSVFGRRKEIELTEETGE